MKKIIFIAVLLLSVSSTFAQLNFGIKAGYNSSLTFSNVSSISDGTYNLNSVNNEIWHNFQAGIFTRVGIGDKIYFQPELLYSIQKKDYKVTLKDVSNNTVTVDKLASVSTVDIPLLIGMKLLDLKVANIRAFAGPKLRFNAGSSLDFNNVTGGNFQMSDLSRDIKASQIGLEVGAGVDVLMFTLDARYNIIGDMYTTKLKDLTLQNMPQNTFVISLGWKLF
jgi:hypothetical protein